MFVEVSDFKPAQYIDIQSAASEEWAFDDWRLAKDKTTMTASAKSHLCGGETENEFARRLAKAIFKANGAPCKVKVLATCLEDLPYESYTFSEKDTDLMEKSED
jgi:hypothetical protein